MIFYKFEQTCSNVQFIPSPIGEGILATVVKQKNTACNVTKKTLKNCISTILQGQILRLDTLGLVGYFTSLEDI